MRLPEAQASGIGRSEDRRGPRVPGATSRRRSRLAAHSAGAREGPPRSEGQALKLAPGRRREAPRREPGAGRARARRRPRRRLRSAAGLTQTPDDGCRAFARRERRPRPQTGTDLLCSRLGCDRGERAAQVLRQRAPGLRGAGFQGAMHAVRHISNLHKLAHTVRMLTDKLHEGRGFSPARRPSSSGADRARAAGPSRASPSPRGPPP